MFSNELICNILEYINDNINKEITIDELSILFYFDKTYIMKKFKKEMKLTIHSYINHIRIYNSIFLFNNSSILSIGIKNGFNSLEYFSETFKIILGVNPSTYKKFITNRNISNKDLTTIQNNIIKLKNIKDDTTKYLNNRKPKTKQVKIFKIK